MVTPLILMMSKEGVIIISVTLYSMIFVNSLPYKRKYVVLTLVD